MKTLNNDIFKKLDDDYIIIDDFLPSNQADEIEKFLTTIGEEWKFNVATSQKYDYDEQRKYDDNIIVLNYFINKIIVKYMLCTKI